MRPRLVDVAQARLVDEAADCIAPGKVGLEHPAVQRTLLPCGIGKSSVARLRRTLRLAGDDRAEFDEEGKPLFGCDLWLVHDRLEQDAGAFDEILALDANQRIERQRVSGCLLGYFSRRGCRAGTVHAHCRAPAAGSRSDSVSATKAGFSDPSTSSVFWVFMITCPPSLGSIPASTTRNLTRAPAGTGARKRTLSIP